MEQNREVILACLNLASTSDVDVHFYDAIGRAIVTLSVEHFDLSREHIRNVSRQSRWDVEVYTFAAWERKRQMAIVNFSSIMHVTPKLARVLVGEGYLSFDDIAVIDPDYLSQLGNFDERTIEEIITHAEVLAQRAAAEIA